MPGKENRGTGFYRVGNLFSVLANPDLAVVLDSLTADNLTNWTDSQSYLLTRARDDSSS